MKRNDALHMHSHLSAFASASTTIVRVIGLLLAYEDTTGEMQEAINLFSPLWTSKTRFLPHTSLVGLANEAAVRTNRRYERAHSHYAEADKLSELVERVHTLTEFTRLPGANLDITLADAPFTSDVEWTQSLIIPVVNKTSPIVKHVGDLMAQHLLSKCQDVRAPCENRPGPPSGFYHASLYYNQTNTTLDRDGINWEVGFDPLETLRNNSVLLAKTAFGQTRRAKGIYIVDVTPRSAAFTPASVGTWELLAFVPFGVRFSEPVILKPAPWSAALAVKPPSWDIPSASEMSGHPTRWRRKWPGSGWAGG